MTDLAAPHFICVGTHHKTGTMWMRRVFRGIARRLDLPMKHASPNWAPRRKAPKTRVILYNWMSRLPERVLRREDTRGLHLIRDPRDVLVSGMRYHMRAKDEQFLFTPRKKFGGRSYQGYLMHLPDDPARLMFEMEEMHRRAIHQMREWNYDQPNVAELRYEELIADTDCEIFSEVLFFLGFSEEEVMIGRQVFWNHSLFGRLADKSRRDARVDLHISSGATGQWRTTFTPEVAEVYAERYGHDLVALGYEPHPTDWVSEIES